jgi:hypothetical protein
LIESQVCSGTSGSHEEVSSESRWSRKLVQGVSEVSIESRVSSGSRDGVSGEFRLSRELVKVVAWESQVSRELVKGVACES